MKKLKKSTKSGLTKYTIAFDIDGTICQPIRNKQEQDILKVYPYLNMISLIKNLKKEGHKIIIFTRRGNLKNGRKLTIKWLKKWNIPYDKLITNKPHYDLFIDDKAENYSRKYWSSKLIKRIIEENNFNSFLVEYRE